MKHNYYLCMFVICSMYVCMYVVRTIEYEFLRATQAASSVGSDARHQNYFIGKSCHVDMYVLKYE